MSESKDPVLFVQYPRCSTCRKAKKWLDGKGVAYIERHIVEQRPTLDELEAWVGLSGLPLRRFFNTSGMRYRELNMKDRFAAGITDKECLDLLASDGMLVRRPLVVGNDFVLVGFGEDAWEERLA